MGWLGFRPEHLAFPSFTAQFSAAERRIGKGAGAVAIADLNIKAESLPSKVPGVPAAQLKTKTLTNVHAVTNSLYKVGKGQVVICDL